MSLVASDQSILIASVALDCDTFEQCGMTLASTSCRGHDAHLAATTQTTIYTIAHASILLSPSLFLLVCTLVIIRHLHSSSMPLHPTLAAIFTRAGLDPSTLTTRGPIVTSPSGKYYAKTARGHSAAQMRGEASSLAAMARTAPPGLIPRILGYVDADAAEDETGALVTEYADGRGGGGQAALGRVLALMHRPPAEQAGEEGGGPDVEYNGKFGFPVPTHCGATEQDNAWEESWEVFFRERRLGDLVRRIGDARVDKAWKRCLER